MAISGFRRVSIGLGNCDSKSGRVITVVVVVASCKSRIDFVVVEVVNIAIHSFFIVPDVKVPLIKRREVKSRY